MMTQKWQALIDNLKILQRAAVAFSGGVDSTLLLKAAQVALGEHVVALTLVSPSFPERERAEADQLADQLGVKQVHLHSEEFKLFKYQQNTPDRCYFCKTSLSQLLVDYARKHDYPHILEGTNADDLDGHRPGFRALQESGIRSPLKEVGLTKPEIRQLAAELQLPNWNKPSAACLASRVPYGIPITREILQQVNQAENALVDMGFGQLRVRHHQQIARIEVPPEQFQKVLSRKEQIIKHLKKVGYLYITLDLSGFRSGSLIEGIQNHGSQSSQTAAD